MSQTAQTWTLAIATISAALLGVIVTFVGTSYQQRAQAAKEARARQDAALAELLAAAENLVLSVRAIWLNYSNRNLKWIYFRMYAVLVRAYGLIYKTDPSKLPTSWRGYITPQNPLKKKTYLAAARLFTDVNMIEAALEIDQQLKSFQRMLALDTARILNPELTRYLAAAALLTLGEDKEIADLVRNLTSKLTAVPSIIVFTPREQFERLASEAEQALEEFRTEVNKRRS
jgi:predicted transcriptional regulator